MGNKYELLLNPFQDFIMNLITENEIDITTKNNKVEISNIFTAILTSFVEDEDFIKELNFDIVKDDEDNYQILAYNEISALWLSGYLLTDPKLANEEYYLLGNSDRKMCYDKKTVKISTL